METVKKAGHMDDVYFGRIMNDMQNGVLAVGSNGTIIYANPQMNGFLEEEDVSGKTMYSLMEKNDIPENDDFWNTVLDVVHSHEIHHQKKVGFRARSGQMYSFHVTSSYLTAISKQEGDSGGVVLTVADETKYDALIQKKHDATIVLIGLMLLVCATVFVEALHTFLNGSFPHEWIARSTEIGGLVLMTVFLKFTSLRVSDFGLLPKNLKRELGESFLLVGLLIFGLSAAKMMMMWLGSPLFPEQSPFFDFSAPPRFYYIKYIAIVFMQELMTRCGMQKSIHKILDNKYKNFVSVLCTSMIFMAVHVQHGLVYMIGAALLNVVLASVYNRHDSLLGTCMIHYTFGIMGLVLRWIS